MCDMCVWNFICCALHVEVFEEPAMPLQYLPAWDRESEITSEVERSAAHQPDDRRGCDLESPYPGESRGVGP